MRQLPLDMGLAHAPTLENYLLGDNEAAVRHLQLWLRPGSRSPVPTYLWGEPGSGKTHLLEAVRRELQNQGARVGWLDASVLMPPAFDDQWAVLLLDDVEQFNAEQQHAAFNWFVNAQTFGRWVVAAGLLPPSDLKLRDDLRSRLGWGHVFALQVLGESQRRAVLRQTADARGIFLSDDVMDFMLNRFSRDLGSLMQLLEQLDRYALASKRAITIPLIKSMLESD